MQRNEIQSNSNFLPKRNHLRGVFFNLTLFVTVFMSTLVQAQTPSAIVEFESTEKGILIPRMTGNEISGIVSAVEGLMVYNTDTHQFMYHNGTDWQTFITGPIGPEGVGIDSVSAMDGGSGTVEISFHLTDMSIHKVLTPNIKGDRGEKGDDGVGIAQTISLMGDSLALSDGGGKVKIDTSNTNEKITGFGIVGDSLYIKEGSMDTMKVAIVSKTYIDEIVLSVMNTFAKSNETFTSPTRGTVTDIDGNTYDIIKIGSQWWMAENLRTTRYRDGSAIDSANSNGQWTTNVTNGKWCWYNGDSMTYEVPYGKLYNWYAVDDSRGLCPLGWHVPSDDVAGGDSEWQILTDFLINNGYGYEGSGNDIGKSMAATFGWASSGNPGEVGNDQGSNNSSGFSGLPGGTRLGNGTFINVGDSGLWWSSTESISNHAWIRFLYYIDGIVYRNNGAKELGLSVRCLRYPN